ncbi:MAG: hypothetical protein KAW41_03940 [Candidatus Diapherotrites archaeon]|nr:hypothetical protein [Candidatus Diapherotrites archaeon]
MKFAISREVARKYPGLKIGIVVVKRLDNSDYPDSIRLLKQNAEEYTKFNFRGLVHPHLLAWREAYKKFGCDGGCSAEWLVKRILEKKALPKINKLVDIYNLVSAKNAMPIGGQDLDRICGDIVLRISPGGERFVGIGGKEEKTTPGEVVYADDEKVLCRNWNQKDCDAAKFTKETKKAVLFVDGIGGISEEAVKKTAKDLESIITEYGNGVATSYFLVGANSVSL